MLIPHLHKALPVIANCKTTHNMSRSIHTTHKDLKGLTKKELDEQFNDPNSDLSALAKKSSLKKKVLKVRKQKKSE
jgi:hypothetical protein